MTHILSSQSVVMRWLNTIILLFIFTIDLNLAQAETIQPGHLALIDSEIDDLNGVNGLAGANSVAVSGDGQFVYVAGFFDDAVAVFNRHLTDGTLTFVQSIKNIDINNNGLNKPTMIVVSPDDKHVYVASTFDDAVVVFTRDQQTGQLTLVEIQKKGVNGGNGLGGANSVAFSSDHRRVYVTGNQDKTVTVFDRDVNTGALTFLQMQQDGENGVDGLDGATTVTVSRDNIFIYVTGNKDNAIALFTRNPALGELSFVETITDVMSGPHDLVISPDNQYAYVTSNTESTLVVFRRDLLSGGLTLLQTYRNGENGISGLSGAGNLTLSPDGNTLYVAGRYDNAIAVFSRDAATGLLTFNQYVQHNRDGITTLQAVTDVVPDPSGSFIYATAFSSNAVNAFSTPTTTITETDLKVEITTPTTTIKANSPLTHTVLVTNQGPDSATGIELSHTLPPNVTLETAQSDARCALNGQTVLCQLGQLNRNESTETRLQLMAPNTPGPKILTARVKGTEPDSQPSNNIASHQITVDASQFDLVLLEAVATPTTVNVNTDFNYTVTLTNRSTTSADNATLTTTLPAQVNYVSDTVGCTQIQSQLTCHLGVLNANESRSVTITAKAIQKADIVATTFTVNSTVSEANQTNNSKSVNISIIEVSRPDAVDLSVHIQGGETAVQVNNAMTYSMVVTNQGTSATEAKLDVTLAGSSINMGQVSGENCGTGNPLSCTLSAIPAGQSKTVTIQVTPTAAGNIAIAASVAAIGGLTDTNSSNNSASKITTISNTDTAQNADVSITLTATPSPAALGKEMTYTLNVTNSGLVQASGVQLSHQLPLGVTFVSSDSRCNPPQNHVIACVLGPLNPNETISLNTVVMTPATAGQLTSQVTVTSTSPDSNPANNTATLVTEISALTADLGLTLSATPNALSINESVSYNFNITNNGPDPIATAVITNTFSNNVLLQEVSSNCPNVINEGLKISCTLSNLLSGQATHVTLNIQANTSGTLTNTAQIQGQAFDPNPANNTATVSTLVNDATGSPTTSAALFFIEVQKNGFKEVLGLQGVMDIAVSPDDQQVYAVSFNDNALVAFSRDQETGQLDFIQVLVDDTNNIDGLAKASSVSLSPDGAFVYVTGFNDSAVAVFRRDTTEGTLSFVEVHQKSQNEIEGLGGALAVEATENYVYVAGNSDDAIAVFSRNVDTGQLNFLQTVRFEDAPQNLDGINALAVSPDGLHLFATSFNSNRLSVFSRDLTSGHLNLIQTLTNNTGGIQGLDKASGVIVSPDNRQVYAIGGGIDNALVVFSRSPETGKLVFMEVHRDSVEGVDGLSGASGLAISPDGRYIYVAGTNDNAIAVFRRNPETGKLEFADIRKNELDDIEGLGGIKSIAVSQLGSHVYGAGFSDQAIAVFSVATADLTIGITESEEPVRIGNNLVYTLTVTNKGPQPATDIVLEEILPKNIRLISFGPSQGHCSASPNNDKINCALGTLNKDAKLTVSVVVLPLDTGELSQQVTVSSAQFDPSINMATETTDVISEADLWLSMTAAPEPLRIESNLTYQITIKNNGPDEAKNITMTDKLPNNVQFISAIIGTEPCIFQEGNRTIQCTTPHLIAGTKTTVTLIVKPTTPGVMFTNTASVTSGTTDPYAHNNQFTKTTEVLFNLIEENYDNRGQNLHDYEIGPMGAVIGGSVSGQIDNQGLLSNVWVLPDTIVSGGKLAKNIVNEGIIENVQLLSGTIVNGGLLRGQIVGFPSDPAILNAQIAADAQLSYVTIGLESQVNPNAKLGEGVTFLANNTIPEGMDLTPIWPSIIEPITQSIAVNLASTVLTNGTSLLEAINAIPELRDNQLAFSQSPQTGHLSLLIGEENMVLVPTRVFQGSSAQAAQPSMVVHPNGQVTFITQTGRIIEAQPATESPTDLQTALAHFGLTQFKAGTDGNITLFTGGDQVKIRPNLYTQPASLFKPLGVEGLPSPSLQGLTEFVLRFIDQTGQRRAQYFYPTAAHQQELQSVLKGIPGASSVEFYNNGKVSVKIGARTYSGLFDYMVSTGPSNTVTQLLIIPDKNGDSSEEIQIIYANGDQQLLYLMPFPEVATEIQNIPEVQQAGYQVAQDMSGHYVLNQGGNRLLMKMTQLVELTESLPHRMVIYPDEQVEFITEMGSQLIMQPLVQDFAALESQLRSLGISQLRVDNNGNLTATFNDTLSLIARPDLQSTFSWLSMPLGLRATPTSLPGVLTTLFVFRDEVGNKRQQFIYPVAKYPKKLYDFFVNMPGIQSVRLDNEGTISVRVAGITHRGIFDYFVESGHLATGGLQFMVIPDVNGDEIEDFAIIYDTGEKQVIYQIPYL